MRQSLSRRLRVRARSSFVRPVVERLEDRTVPTVQLFVDFGEAFPIGGLAMTASSLGNGFAAGGLQGPKASDLGVSSKATLTFQSLQSQIVGKQDYNGDGVMDSSDYTDLRNDVLELVKRYYEPFNVNVQAASHSGIADMRGAMTANNADAVESGIYDAYVFCGRVNAPGVGSIGAARGLTGAAGVDSTWGAGVVANDLDNTSLVFADVLVNRATGTDLASRLAFSIAAEAGHSFGLDRVDNTTYTVEEAQLASSTIGASEDPSGGDLFTRYPLATNTGATGNAVANFYDLLADFSHSNIGAKADPALVGVGKPNASDPGLAYATGTGAHDIITITQDAAGTAKITVEAYRNADFTGAIAVPGRTGSSYSYTVSLDGGLLVDGGTGADRIIIDARLGKSVTVRGMGGDDQLVIDGQGSNTAVYIPDTTVQTTVNGRQDRRGSIGVGATTVNYQEFEQSGKITIKNVNTATFVSPGGADLLDLQTDNQWTGIQGTSNGGQTFVPFELENVSRLVLDLSAGDGVNGSNDVVTLKSSLAAVGLTSLVVFGGDGNDRFFIEQSELGLPGGFTFHGGNGNDLVEFVGTDLTFGVREAFRFLGGPGADVVRLGAGVLSLPPGASFVFDGGVGNDRLELPASRLAVARSAAFRFIGGPGSDSVVAESATPHSWTIGRNTVTLDNRGVIQSVENVRGGSGVDQFVFQSGSVFPGVLDAGGGADVLNLARLPGVNASLTPSARDGYNVSFKSQATGLVRSVNRLVGGAGPGDVLQGRNVAARWSLTAGLDWYAAGGAVLSFSGFEVLRGGNGSDKLTATAAALGGIVFQAGGGWDSVRINGTAGVDGVVFGPGTVTVNGRTLTFRAIERLDVAGGAGNDSFTSRGGFLGVGTVQLSGEGGDDLFTMSPALGTNFRLLGGGHSAGDVLDLLRSAASYASPRPSPLARAGRFSFVGLGFVDFTGIETTIGTRNLFSPD